MSKTITEQLKNFKPNLAIDLMSRVDGVDHINISVSGKTKLGQALAFEANQRMIHPILGPFNCLTGYWCYIKSESRRPVYRSKPAKSCQYIAKQHNDTRDNIPNFKALIASGIYYKIISDETLKQMVIDSSLPFMMYYVNNQKDKNLKTGKEIVYEVKVPQKFSTWIIPAFEEIRSALKEGREPDIDQFRDKGNTDPLYQNYVSYRDVDEDPEEENAPEENTETASSTDRVDTDRVEEETVSEAPGVINE